MSMMQENRTYTYRYISPNVPKPKPLEMYLDTGASSTTISLKDTEELGVDAGGLPPSGKTNYGYGGRLDVRRLPEVCMVLMTDDRNGFPVCMEHIQVNYTFSAVKKKDKDSIVYGMPSVLGVDILVKAGFGMHASWKERKAHLTA
jgi:hypothetical protein